MFLHQLITSLIANGVSRATTSLLGWDPNRFSESYGVGEPNPNCHVKIVSPETLQEVPKGERGELWARGPNIMKGYWKNPKATRDTITRDRWLRTGDVAVLNDDGVIFIVDRIKVNIAGALSYSQSETDKTFC